MIYPSVPVEDWAKEWGIDITPDECVNCKKVFPYTIPVALKGYRGVLAELHECGEKYQRSILRPVGETLKWWQENL